MTLLSSQVSIPSAQRAAARLGCGETFAIVDDQRACSLRRIWIAEQTKLNTYELREELGQGMVGRELDDPFALVYLQACQCNVNWLMIPASREDGAHEIRDQFGNIIIHRILSLRDTYDRGPALSEASLLSKSKGDAVWVSIEDPQGSEIANAPVRIAEREDEHDDNGNLERVTFHLKPDGKLVDVGSAAAPPALSNAVQSAVDAELTTLVLENAANPSGSQAGNDNLKLCQATDKKIEDDEDDGNEDSKDTNSDGDGDSEDAEDA